MTRPLSPILLTAALLAGATAQSSAQIVFEASDLPQAGDVIQRFRDTLAPAGPGPSGGPNTWDFSMAVPRVAITTTIVEASATPFASEFADAELAMVTAGAYFYMRMEGTEVRALGTSIDFLGTGDPLAIRFNPDMTVHQLPRNYGSNFQDDYYFEAEVQDINFGGLSFHAARLRHYGDIRDTTDAYGTVITPAGSFDCLRVKSTEYSIDSVWVKFFSFSPWMYQSAFSGPRQSTSYQWLGKQTKLPVAELTLDTSGAPRFLTYTDVNTSSPSLFAEGFRAWHDAQSDAIVADPGNIAQPASLEVMALDGRLIHSAKVHPGQQVRIPAGTLPAGLTVVRLFSGSASAVRRLVVR